MPGSGLNLDVAASMASAKSVAGIVDEMQQVIRAIQTASQNAATTWKGVRRAPTTRHTQTGTRAQPS